MSDESDGLFRTAPETVVPDGTAVATCPYCGQPFTAEHLRDLHVGEVHDTTDSEWEAYESAVETEEEDLFMYHLKVAGALSVVYAILFLLAIIGFTL